MGKKGKYADFNLKRNCELHHAYHNALATAKCPFTIKQIFEITVNTPCSQFWVSSETAHAMISLIRRGLVKENMLPSKREMYFEIMKRCNGNYTKLNIEQIVNSPAPKFYLTPKSAHVILCQFRKCTK